MFTHPVPMSEIAVEALRMALINEYPDQADTIRASSALALLGFHMIRYPAPMSAASRAAHVAEALVQPSAKSW